MAGDFAEDIAGRCRWALAHNNGDPEPAWSTGEQLIVALVLENQAYLDEAGWTAVEVTERLGGELGVGPGFDGTKFVAAWLTRVRAAVRSTPPPAGPSPGTWAAAKALVDRYRRWDTATTSERLNPDTQREVTLNPWKWIEEAIPLLEELAGGQAADRASGERDADTVKAANQEITESLHKGSAWA